MEPARFCGTCGRLMIGATLNAPIRKRITASAAFRMGASVVVWAAFYVMVAANVNSRPVDRVKAADRPPRHARATGLIMDLPADYPASFFTRHAVRFEEPPTRNEVG